MTDDLPPTDPTGAGEATLFPKTVGERLRGARLALKLDLTDIAQRTRIPLRHLEAIESGDYSGMPTPTYTVGFAKAYARAVGEDEVEIAREVRGKAEISAAQRPEFQPYETHEAARAPSSGVMIGAIVLAVLLLVAVGLWFGTSLFRGDGLDTPAPAATESFAPEAEPAQAPIAAAAGQVTLVANDEVWVRVYDATGQTLLQKTLQAGERYDVPADANGPMINVGRPDKLQVLLNGSAVAPLGDGRIAIKDVGIGAAALQARAQGGPAPQGTTVPQPAASAAPAARPSASPSPSRTVPAAFRAPVRPAAAPASVGQRETPPAAATPAAVPIASAPGNGT